MTPDVARSEGTSHCWLLLARNAGHTEHGYVAFVNLTWASVMVHLLPAPYKRLPRLKLSVHEHHVCMEGSYWCIVACTHLATSTCCRTVTMVAPLLLTSGPVRYEAVLHSCGTSPVGDGGLLPSCDSVHSGQLYSPASLGHQAAGTITGYPTQSHYPNTEPTSPCLNLIMLSIGLGSTKYQY